MKISIPSPRLGRLWVIAVLTGAGVIWPWGLFAADQNESQPKAAMGQRTFASPEEAITALKAATEAKDRNDMRRLFGPDFDQLLTGDPKQDAKHAEKFAAAVAQSCKPVPEGNDKIGLEIGTNEWPMPIPLVKADGQWHFDTAAGKEEIINRHVGRDELHAIGVCRAYVKAQQEYAKEGVGASGSYALKFKSSPGKRDGLYWKAADGESAAPFGAVLTDAQSDGLVNDTGAAPQPFHGYYFKILTKQGNEAPGGKKDYLSEGMLSGGFALVAYPAQWDKSGVMTFIVNQDGNVYERNFGEKTSRIARRMKEYNPDGDWKLVQDEGILSAAFEE
jgi:hypothetical protein